MWEINNFFQWLSFGRAIIFGFLLCLVYDVLRLDIFIFKKGVVAQIINDLIFWIIAMVTTFCFLLATTGGQVRMYVFIGMGIGFLAFKLTLSRFIFWCVKPIRKFYIAVSKRYKKLILKLQNFSPFVLINKNMKKLLCFLSKKRKIS